MYNDFSKRINSTKRPAIDGTQGAPFEAVLKAPTSRVNPVLLLENQWNVEDIPNYSYAYFMGSYYYVTGVTAVTNTIFEVSMEMDALATLKNDILNTTAHVLYSSQGNIMITDMRNTKTNRVERKFKLQLIPEFVSGYTYIVLIRTTESSPAAGLVSAMSMTQSQLSTLSDWLSSYHFYNTGPADALKVPIDMWDSVISCIYMPIGETKLEGKYVELNVAGESTGITGKLLSSWNISGSVDIAIPWPFDNVTTEAVDDNYLNYLPYTTMTLHLPYYGLVEINQGLLQGQTKISVEYSIDITTSDIVYNVYADSNRVHLIGTYSAQCGSQIPISAETGNPMGAVQAAGSIMGGILGAFGGNPLGAAMEMATAGQYLQRYTQVKGSLSSRAAGAIEAGLVMFSEYNVAAESPEAKKATIGLPLAKTVRLGTLTGYVQTSNASVSAQAEKQIIEEVNAMLDGGIYIE